MEDGGFAEFLLRRGISADLDVDEITRLGPAPFAPVRWAQEFRALAGRSIESSFPPSEAGLLMGLALGDDSGLDPVLERDFRATGLSHLLVVSGENVAMVLAPIVALGGALRWSRWSRFALGIGTVAFFVVLTGAEPSVMRAGVMAVLALMGVLLGRPRSTGSILAGAVVILLVIDPALVWSVGFQLSVAATASMVALATPISRRIRFLPSSLSLAAGATLAAQVGVTPLLLFYFHEVPVSTVAANVLAFPAVAPALLLGLAAATIGIVVPAAGHLVSILALVPMRYLEIVADRLARSPIPWITGGGASTLILGLGLVVLLAWWLRAGRRLPRRALVGILAALPLLVWSNAISAGPPTALTVRFFDVGQETRRCSRRRGCRDPGRRRPRPAQVATELAALGVKRLDVVIASHPHADHVVGSRRCSLGSPSVCCSSRDVGRLAGRGRARRGRRGRAPQGPAREGGRRAAGGRRPPRDPVAGPLLVRHRVRHEQRCDRCQREPRGGLRPVRDRTRGACSRCCSTRARACADVLKVPHHGAATSIEPFFEAVGAEVAVVSVGPNTYGHPVPEVLDWIRATGAEVFRTDRAGT